MRLTMNLQDLLGHKMLDKYEGGIGFNVVYQQFRAMYNSGCQICCNWSRLKPGFRVPVHLSTMPQINMIPHPVTLN